MRPFVAGAPDHGNRRKAIPEGCFHQEAEANLPGTSATAERSFRHFLFRSRQYTADVTVTSIWVAGSYARGAFNCGDLDVVFQAEETRNMPSQSAITRSFFGTLAYVRYYIGDPQKNASGIEFPDAVQIWSCPGCDWATAITEPAHK